MTCSAKRDELSQHTFQSGTEGCSNGSWIHSNVHVFGIYQMHLQMERKNISKALLDEFFFN